MMQDLSTHPTRLDPPPLDTAAQRAHYLWLALKRRTNLLLGRPGTPNAATLSSMLSTLLSATAPHLSATAPTVGLALPNAALASHQELTDALTHAGLPPLGPYQLPDYEPNAAYAAAGLGLCPSYRDPYRCEQEEDAFGEDSVLHLDFTNRTLAVDTAVLSTARQTYATVELASWELGRNNAAAGGGQNKWATEGEYWNAVRESIREVATRRRGRPLSQLLLTGECAGDERFLEVVRDAMQGVGVAEKVGRGDFTSVVARGAADLQRRRQQGWGACVQPKNCPQATEGGNAAGWATEEVLEL